MKAHVLSGLDQIASYDKLLKGRRIGLMTNPTGINHAFQTAVDIMANSYRLTALFACEHGIRGTQQAGDKVDKEVDARTGITVYSTYGNQGLSQEMLDAFDLFVFDMQDVGARFYTYLYSLSYAMISCAKAGKPMLVLDRINPLGGKKIEGTILDERLHSFVGEYAIPTRYGMTIGEFALWVKHHLALDLDLTIAPLKGWYRDFMLPDVDIPWVAPSPNCATFSAALCYIGTCIFEGTNISEGRGTVLPFEMIGAPWINEDALAEKSNALHLPGVYFRPCAFTPTFSKHAQELCHGVQVHVTDVDQFDSFASGLYLMDAVRDISEDKFEFLPGQDANSPTHLDKLLGTDTYRLDNKKADDLLKAIQVLLSDFRKEREDFLLYHR